MRRDTAILEEELTRRWIMAKQREIDQRRWLMRRTRAYHRWRKGLLWLACAALGISCVVFAVWMAS